jgi:hypothetical protein
VVSKGSGLLGILLVFSISVTTAFAFTELESVTISDPRLETAIGGAIGNDITVDQQVQISADITNNQEKPQKFAYLVQIKDKAGFVTSLSFFTGVEIDSYKKFSPSISWTPKKPGEFTAEIYVWDDLKNNNALSEYVIIQINVS